MRPLSTVCALLCLFFGGLSSAHAYSGGPPSGMANDPPQNHNCTQCHSSYDLNSGSGTLTLDAPSLYVAGETYTLTVNLEQTDAQRWGFQLIAKDAEYNPVGSFQVTDPQNVQMNGPYVNHTQTGTFQGTTGSASWSVDWLAPAEDIGPVSFYFTGNASDGGGNSLLDHIYAATNTIQFNNPPLAFDLVAPSDGHTFFEWLDNWFMWNPSSDPETGSVTYNMVYALDAEFTDPTIITGIEATNWYQEPNTFTGPNTYYWKVQASDGAQTTDSNETRTLIVQTDNAAGESPGQIASWALTALYPNPFNASVTVRIAVPQLADLRLEVYDLLGRHVETLHSGAVQPGYRSWSWRGQGASGVYMLRAASSTGWQMSRKVVALQ